MGILREQEQASASGKEGGSDRAVFCLLQKAHIRQGSGRWSAPRNVGPRLLEPILFSAKWRVSSCSVPFVPVVSDALSMKCRGTSGQVGAEEESVRFWGYMGILAAWVSLRRFSEHQTEHPGCPKTLDHLSNCHK